MSILLMLVVGPLFIFSTLSGLVLPNPVHGGRQNFAFIIKKSLNHTELQKLTKESPADAKANLKALNLDEMDFEDLEASSLNIFALDDTDTDFIEQNKKEANDDDKTVAKQVVVYKFYKSTNPLLLQFTPAMFDNTTYNNWTETRFFGANQVQNAIFEEYA